MIYDYYQTENLYTKEECKELIEIAKSNPSRDWHDQPATGKKVNVIVAELKPLKKKLRRFFDNVISINQRCFEFDLYKPNAGVNFNFYSGENNEYPFHQDANNYTPRLDVKLTAIMNLSQEPYEGGDFQLFFGDKISNMDVLQKTGSLFVFPSFFYHRVAPVTKGERITMSYWFKGPSWK